MKGLLIKDFRFLLGQQKFFLTVAAIGILFMFLNADPSFAIGYMTVLCSFFTISTISYDEFDNGMAFLMTLPFERKRYVQEKYLFGILCALFADVVSVLAAIVYLFFMQSTTNWMKAVLTGIVMLGMVLLFLMVSIPIEIKFGVEKGRIAMFLVYGIIFLGIFIIGMLLAKMNVDMEMLLVNIMQMKRSMLILAAVLFLGVAGVISYFLSVRFIEKKEF